MCLYLYMGSSVALPLIPFDKESPWFSVEELKGHEKTVIPHFTKPFVYFVGAQGCGCDFQYGEYPGYEEPAEIATATALRQRLCEYVTTALEHQPEIELYACWAGEEDQPAQYRAEMRPKDLTTERTFFQQREFIVVKPDQR